MFRAGSLFLLVFITIACVVEVRSAVGQTMTSPCEPGVRPIPGVLGYALRKADPRCEGIYRSPVGGKLEVVSVTLGHFEFDVQKDERLIVSLPDLSGLGTDTVRIRAVAIPLKTYYRMDARLVVGETLRWPIGEVVRPLRLSSDQLGVFGLADHDYIPVAVTPEGKPPSGIKSAVQIKLRSHIDLQSVVWRTISAGGAATRYEPLVGATVHGGEAIKLTLPTGPAGLMQLDFKAKEPDSNQWRALRVKVWRPNS